ncbi:hypothetical protein BsWGS_09135 [Bradybaena similaris]
MSEFRGRVRSRGTRGRGGPFRGGPRRGGYTDERDSSRGGFSRGRGDGGFSRGGRGGPPRHLSRDDSPPRKSLMSRGYDSERGRGPPVDRRMDRYEDSYERGIPSRSREIYSSPPRDTGRLMDRSSPPPRGSYQDRDHGMSSRGDGDYPSSRDFLSPRSSYRDSYGSSMREMRDERRESFSRPSPREYLPQRSAIEYSERSREFREPPREYGSSREFREPMNGRGEFRDREYPSRMLSRERVSSREYGRGGPRGGPRGGRDDRDGFRGSRGGYMNGSRSRGGAPRGRGRGDFRRTSPPSRDGPIVKRARMDAEDGYSRR